MQAGVKSATVKLISQLVGIINQCIGWRARRKLVEPGSESFRVAVAVALEPEPLKAVQARRLVEGVCERPCLRRCVGARTRPVCRVP